MNNVKKVKIRLIDFFLKNPKGSQWKKRCHERDLSNGLLPPSIIFTKSTHQDGEYTQVIILYICFYFHKCFLCVWNIAAGKFLQTYWLSIFSDGLTLHPWVSETHTWWPQWWPGWRGRWWPSAASSATSPPAWSPLSPALSLWLTAKLKIWKVKKNVLP